METTFEQEKSKAIDILLNTRELSTLLDIKNYVTRRKDELDYKGVSEYDYCKQEGRFDTLTEIENLINEKIKNLKG